MNLSDCNIDLIELKWHQQIAIQNSITVIVIQLITVIVIEFLHYLKKSIIPKLQLINWIIVYIVLEQLTMAKYVNL